ncbi:lipocalin family protein [Sphingopyxis sp. KK2]|uniref:lipocalin family protein n=1 Tax=Sphingopyxis sp. KK2 TaxID=1855727 RepID=UPI00097E5D84|nr:lipocalin family protein [Sphingopyxis sp. KK2]
MRKAAIAAAAVTAAALPALWAAWKYVPRPGPVGNPSVPQPAKAVDLDRYLGRWYEQFRYEASFQKDMEAVTADYSLTGDGTIRVVNQARSGGVHGRHRRSVGTAKLIDKARGAKLKVSFFGPFYGNYWVLDHGEDYEWSIVGEPTGRYLWVLTRDMWPTQTLLRHLETRVRELGYDWSLVRRTQQPPTAV